MTACAWTRAESRKVYVGRLPNIKTNTLRLANAYMKLNIATNVSRVVCWWSPRTPQLGSKAVRTVGQLHV